MKKLLIAVLMLTLVVTMLSACGASSKVVVGTGGTTGTYYAFTNAVGTVMQSKTNHVLNVVSTGGSVANIKGINDGDYSMAIVQNDTMINAYNNLDSDNFSSAIQSFSVLGEVYSEVVQIVVDGSLKNTVKSLADLRGLRVSVGDVGSGVYKNAKQLLGAVGVDIDKDIIQNNLSVGNSAEQMKDGKLDAFFFTSGAPATAITDLGLSKEVFLLSIDDAVMTQFIADHKIDNQYEVYSVQTITNEQYSFISKDEPVKTIGVTATFIVANSLSEDVVYDLTKALWENKSEIAKAHAVGKSMDIACAFLTIGNVPLHPGAAKYYTEMGLYSVSK